MNKKGPLIVCCDQDTQKHEEHCMLTLCNLTKSHTLAGSPALTCFPKVSGNLSVANFFDLAFARSNAV